MNKDLLKKILTYAGISLFLLILAYAFVPEVLSGKVVDQSDISGYMGMAKETNDWDAAHPDDKTAWTNSMFGGMPTTMLNGNTAGDFTKKLYDLTFIGPRPASYLFISLLGAFLLMLALGLSPLIATGGAIAVTFCSYNMQIIQVGHNAKMVALAFLPWVLAAVIFTYKAAFARLEGKWKEWLPKTVLGASLFAMALNFQIKANHVQITYYLAIIIFCYVAVLLAWMAKKDNRKYFGRFMTASALLLVLGLTGIGTNANRLIPTYEYTKHTMRGGSELSSAGGSDSEKSKGLDLEYATAWSYGWEELPNMMIPDYNGGSSTYSVNPMKSETITLLRDNGQQNWRQIAKALPLYWGPQPFTAGPMYMGAITMFLFILGLGLYKGKEKWWILIPTLIGIGLGLGSHFMGFTKIWYYYIPFYSKFRTVSMALVILQFTLPMLGFLTLDGIIKGRYSRQEFLRWGLVALAVTAGFSLLAAFGIGRTFTGPTDAGQQDVLVDAFIVDRMNLLLKDGLVACGFIVATFALLYWAVFGLRKPVDDGTDAPAGTMNLKIAGAAICALVLINMFSIGKRYLNDDHFVRRHDFENQFTERVADLSILEDKDPDYRVLDLSVSTFNDSYSSYFHKSIGGYSPVKLQRYQDLIDNYIVPECNAILRAIQNATTIGEAEEALPSTPVLDMLNDRYIIVNDEIPALRNETAMGNAWFVDSVVKASSADEEIALIGSVDLRTQAVVGSDFSWSAEGMPSADDSIVLSSYAPNALKYTYKAASERIAVFSEIYYPDGWTATVDGEELPLFRADWTLRAAKLPAGEHTVEMRFAPKSYVLSSNISRASSGLLIVLILLSIGGMFLPRKRD